MSLIIFSSCSLIQFRTTYHVDNKLEEEVFPLCSMWNSENGAAYFEIEGLKVIAEVYSSGRPLLVGPILVPIIPAAIFNPHHYETTISSYLGLNFVPPMDKEFSIDLSKQELYFDNQRIKFGESASYSRKTERKGERAHGLINLKEQSEVKFRGQKAFMVRLHGKRFEAPKKMKVVLYLNISGKEVMKTLDFTRSYDWDYIPIWVPTQHTDKKCRAKLPDKKQILFL